MSGLVFLFALILIVVVLALGGLFVVRRLVSHERLARQTDVAGYVYAVIGVVYGVILAQVVVAGWEEYRDARDIAAGEAYAVLNLDRLSRGWPAQERDAVRAALIAYGEEVVQVEWPAMARGDYSSNPHAGVATQLWEIYTRIGQESEERNATYAAALDQLDSLNAARRSRMLLAASSLPQTMTLTLFLGAVVTVGFSYLFTIEDGWLHGLITASLAVLVALLLLLVYQLETPYQGVDSIGPTAMQAVLQEMRAED